jgi:GNAT superfamily N-acetyltransferase
MASCVIRPARAGDAPFLVALDSFASPDNGRAADIARWIAAGQCFCATDEGRPVGYGVLTNHFFGQPMLELVVVAQAERRKGIGAALIRHAMTVSRPVLWSSTNKSNLGMQALLECLGFRRSGIVEGLDEGDPELIYRRNTTASDMN